MLAANADEGPVRVAGAFDSGHCVGRWRHAVAAALAPATASSGSAQPNDRSSAGTEACGKGVTVLRLVFGTCIRIAYENIFNFGVDFFGCPHEPPECCRISSMSSSSVSTAVREISIAHSPDSDDAFMFYALATNKVRVPGLKFSHTLTDIESLNRKAIEGFYDVSAISLHAYPYVQDKYALMPCGGSVGEQYGPMVISPRMVGLEELKTMKVAVPGTMTTAYLALKLFAPKIETAVVPFDRIIPEVVAGKYEAGLIIHEGQLTYERSGLKRIMDLGKWWHGLTGLPLPLGGNAIRRELGAALIGQC